MKARISSLYLYPVKSMAGVAVEQLEFGSIGLEWDRRMMLVEADGTFLTQRQLPSLALITPRLLAGGAGIALKLPTGVECEVLMEQVLDCSKNLRVEVWGEAVEAFDCGDEVAAILSSYVGKDCRLACLDEKAPRIRRKSTEFAMGFADSRPLLLIGEASLEDLNRRLSEHIPMDRFRPNIVLSGLPAYGEDHIESVQIGALTLAEGAPCERCVVVTLNQQTGKRQGREPLKTLGTYRKRDGKVYFGQYLLPMGSGVLRVGDEVLCLGDGFES